MSIIICGFPGTGKSHMFNMFKDRKDLTIMDSDSSKFPKNDFPMNYLNHLRTHTRDRDTILLCSTHKEVVQGLIDNGLNINIVMPTIDMYYTMIQRYIDRGSPKPFVELMKKNYQVFIQDLLSVRSSPYVTHFFLSKEQPYLYDVYIANMDEFTSNGI